MNLQNTIASNAIVGMQLNYGQLNTFFDSE